MAAEFLFIEKQNIVKLFHPRYRKVNVDESMQELHEIDKSHVTCI